MPLINLSNLRTSTVAAVLRRPYTESEESNARLELEVLENHLATVKRAPDGPRRTAAVALLADVVSKAKSAFRAFEAAEKKLTALEAEYSKAAAEEDRAGAAHRKGSLDAAEAVKLKNELEVARAAARVRLDALKEGQRAARLPKPWPEAHQLEARKAEHGTKNLVLALVEYGLEDSYESHRPAVDTFALAIHEGHAEPNVARWWLVYELRELVNLKDVCAKREKKERTAAELERVFEIRWQEFERVEGLPEAQRERMRA